MKLYLRECKRTAAGMVYYLFTAILVFSWHQNFRGFTAAEIARAEKTVQTDGGFDRPLLAKPQETDGFYGTKIKENPEKIMCGMADTLLREYRSNSYTAYPLGYYKSISLDENGQERILEILCEITGLAESQLDTLPKDYFPAVNGTIIHPDGYEVDSGGNIMVKNYADGENAAESFDKTKHFMPQVSYERFQELLAEVKSITKGGYYYSLDILLQYFGQSGMSYDEAMEEYNHAVYDEKTSIPFARLFCDYMGLALGIYPVFISVFLWLKDRLHHVEELLYVRKVSSGKLVLARYFACVTMALLPVIVLSFESLLPLMSFGNAHGISIDRFAYIKYIFWWLLPTVMAVSAIGTFFTLLTDSPLAVFLQFFWWLIDKGVTGLSGGTKITTLMIRHNTLRGYELIQENFSAICINRLLMAAFGILLVMLSVWVLQQKRKGRFHGKVFTNIKNKFSVIHTK